MNISARCEYACRAMVELAGLEQSQRAVTAETIAERRHIPEKFLVHVMLQLKRAGLVRSVRGAQGGYLLARPAQEITLRDIVVAVDGPVMEPLPVEDGAAPYLEAAWRALAARIDVALEGTTLDSLAESAPQQPMWHI